MTNNYTIYRRGVPAFKLESRKQGQIRKVTQALFKEEIMTDDSVRITLVSSVPMDFRLRDYIVFDNRPYFLNLVPESSIEDDRRYTYNLVFEGTMYEMGRVVFLLPESIGYEYYGTLSEHAMNVINNLNRVNMWLEWELGGETHRGKLINVTANGDKLRYQWGRGSMEYYGIDFIYTDRLPEIGDHAIDPFGIYEYIDEITVTALRRWNLSFPKKHEVPAVYPQPVNHIPDDEYVTVWDEENPTFESFDEIAYARNMGYDIHTISIGDIDTVIEWMRFEYVNGSTSFGKIPEPSVPNPQIVGENDYVHQRVTFKVKAIRCYDNPATGEEWIYEEGISEVTIYRKVTYVAVSRLVTSWQIEPIVPESGGITSYDYPTESLLLSYDNHKCLAVVQDLCSQYDGWEWRVEDSVQHSCVNGEMLVCGTLTFRRKSVIVDSLHKVHPMGFGRSGGLRKIKCKYSDDSNVPSRIYFYGGTQNIPQYYRNSRICLPGKNKEASYIDFAEMQVFPLAIGNTLCEDVVCFDGIFPAAKPFEIRENWGISITTNSQGNTFLQLTIPAEQFFLINAKWTSNNKDYEEWLQWRGLIDTQDSAAIYNNYYVNKGVNKYMTGSDTPMFTFQTGEIAGYSLVLGNTYITTVNGADYIVVVLKTSKEDNAENDGYTVPNSDICCRVGDKFIVDGINMPAAYTYYQDGDDTDFSAENALWRASLDYMNEVAGKIDYDVEVARDHVIRHKDKFRTFDSIQFNDVMSVGSPMVEKRIVSVELDLVDGYEYKLSVTNRGMVRPWKTLAKIINTQSSR